MPTSTTNFPFLHIYPAILEPAAKAEAHALADPITACFHARRALEVIIHYLYEHDADFSPPYDNSLNALLSTPDFQTHVPAPIIAKARFLQRQGNIAVHGRAPVRQFDALNAVRELFHFTYWFARTYDNNFAHQGLTFDQALIPQAPDPARTAAAENKLRAQLQALQSDLDAKDKALAQASENRLTLDAEVSRLQAEVAAAKARAAATPDTHDYSEAQTRDAFIDMLLREAGWGQRGWRTGHDIEFPVTGMPSNSGDGFVDYVLWGDDGKPLAVIEAKRTRKDARIGQQQAKLYADCLEKQYGQRPVIFCTNGYQHWIWDDHFYPPRTVGGFYTMAELQRTIARRTTRLDPLSLTIDTATVDRAYQKEATREITSRLTKGYRKGLLVMATGTGKTRTVVALVDLLQRAGWVKNTLFLADRIALVTQAQRAFKKHLPASSPVNLITNPDDTGRVYISTYPTIMNLIEKDRDEGGARRFGPGFFDLVIIDEAHRSVYQKYRAIFDYFDANLVGLTATPRSEVDRDTYGLFDLTPGVPTFAYELDEAVKDGFLVPPHGVSVDLAFPQRGISFDELSAQEKEQWEEIEWDEDDPTSKPRTVEPEAVNRWLFNTDTVDKALAYLMENGIKVAGGDRLGKTIIFAKGKEHARFIEARFNIHYPHLKGTFARVIDHYERYAHQLLDDFEFKDKPPHIAISVDMLDTGIDVPECVNLLFFKMVRSKTKFFQMVGRGTRLCEDLFAPGQHKQKFYIFDFCKNLEYFNQNPKGIEGSAGLPLGAQLFLSRLAVHAQTKPLDTAQDTKTSANEITLLRCDIADHLCKQVASMNLENFIVRTKRATVERFAVRQVWNALSDDDYHVAGDDLARLPDSLDPEDETAKRFDLLILRTQLTILEHDKRFKLYKQQLQDIAQKLAEKKDIPMVSAHTQLILELQSDEWWEHATLPMLEAVRRKLRDLVQFIDKSVRPLIYTSFTDTLGAAVTVDIGGLSQAIDTAQYRQKMLAFLKVSENHIAIRKLRMGESLTPTDIAELERLLFVTSSLGDRATFESAFGIQPSLPLFIRSLVGMDREAAKRAFGEFLSGSNLTANQLRFINYIIDELTKAGAVPPSRLYEPPFTDANPSGLDGLFPDAQAERILRIVQTINTPAATTTTDRAATG